jgi:alkylation response protein AidB-like acyl-CoA dehydrogenase
MVVPQAQQADWRPARPAGMAPRIESATVPVIASGAEAIRVARKFGASIAEGTIGRDRSGAVPARELAAMDASGLLGITVPRKYGGAEVPATALAEVVRVIAAVDPAIAQVPQSHFLFVDVLAVLGTPSQRRRLAAAQDPHTIHRYGQLAARTAAAEALLASAAATLDEIGRVPRDAAAAARGSLAVAQAKAFGSDVAAEVASDLFSLSGASAAGERYDLSRHWRNARTHGSHDPVAWKYHHVGNYLLNGVLPPNHGQI